MLGRRYLEIVQERIAALAAAQDDAVSAAAELAAHAVAAGGALHHFDTGHMKDEPIRRAGGLVALHPLRLDVAVENPLPPRRHACMSEMAQRYVYDREDLAALVLDKSHVQEGDVLVQVSNSGKEPFTVGVALEAKARGAKVIALTSVAFSRELQPKHSSGKRLFEVADAVIDLGAPSGDAVLDVEGVDTPVAATSGVLTACAIWALMAEIVEALVARGITPSIWRSVNLPDGFAYNARQEIRYRENGI